MNYGLTKTRVRLAGSVALVALSAGAAMAQEGVESVVVSSTRLQSAGFDAPTPTTVVSAADLEASAKPNIFNAITELPALQGSTGVSYNTGSTTTGLIGLSSLNMRGLSALRTLVLLDGQRVIGGNFNGAVDVSQMPQMLIQRVDVVTGGASASWGSDAVAGVINFVTDKKFEGFKANAMAGLSTYGDMGNMTFQMAAGTAFMGGRAHFSMSGEYMYSDGLLPRYPVGQQHSAGATNIGGRQLGRISGTASYANDASTPAGQPRTSYYNIVQATQNFAYGGIQGGPKAYTIFTPQGQAQRLDLAGNCFADSTTGALTNAINNTCIGTPADPGDQNMTRQFTQGMVMPLTRGSLYLRLSYDLTPETEIWATLNYGVSRTENIPAQGNSTKTNMIARCDNAYLPGTGLFATAANGGQATPAAGQSQTMANCLTFYPAGTATQIAQNPLNAFGSIPYSSDWANIPTDQLMFLLRTQRRYTVGGNGTFDLFGKSWNWESYFQHGENSTSIKIYNMPLSGAPNAFGLGQNQALSRFNLAQDAVFAADGSIVCRNTIARANGCVPFNPFGGTTISAGSIAYFDNQNGPGGTTLGPTAIMTQRQEAFSLVVNGSPIELWAGPLAVAAGYEYREEYYTQRADPYSAGITASTPATVNEPCTDPFVDCTGLGAWNAGNYQNGRGVYHVNEAFVELGVPILDDDFFGKIDLSLAGRHAIYSQADKGANTWKVGVTWETPIPGIRLRALQSRDIRAPNLSELFSPPQGLNGSINNLFTGQTGQQVRQLNEGNPNLVSEKSQTTEVGIVWQPDFLPGFQASVDYYRIAIKGAIQALDLQQVELLCYNASVAGQTSFACGQDFITTANGVNQSLTDRGGPSAVNGAFSGTVPNQLTAVHSKAFNGATLVVEGIDYEASYQFDLEDYDIPGRFVIRSLAGNISKFISDSGIPGTQRNVELAGFMGGSGGSSTYTQSGGNTMTWKLQQSQSYQNDVWGITLTERWYSSGRFTNKNTIVCAPGTCPPPTTQSPTINFNKMSSILYLDVGLNWNVSESTQLYTKVDNLTNIRPPDNGQQNPNNTLYDVIGRMYRVGVRFSN